MPTPVGHALGGIAAGYLVTGLFTAARAFIHTSVTPAYLSKHVPVLVGVVTLACLGMLPDIDFVFAAHREFTHSIGATLTVMAVSMVMVKRRRLEISCVVGAAYASHIGLDWLTADSSFPVGIMALWPFSTDYYQSSLQWSVFLNVCRQIGEMQCWMNNGLALTRELTILLPATAALIWFQHRLGKY